MGLGITRIELDLADRQRLHPHIRGPELGARSATGWHALPLRSWSAISPPLPARVNSHLHPPEPVEVESAFDRPEAWLCAVHCGINANFNLAQFDRQRAAEFQGCQNWPNVSAACALWREPGHGPKDSENFGVLIQTLPRRTKAIFFEVPVWPNYVTALPRLNLVAVTAGAAFPRV